MAAVSADPEATIAAKRRGRRLWPWLAALAALAIGVVVALAVLQPWRLPPIPIRTADIETILADRPDQMTIFRLDSNPRILVLDFPDLHRQARMLDRIAVFLEKAGNAHDRVLSDAELDAAIAQLGDTYDTLYYGHDYRAADIVRFFATADRQGLALNEDEERLRALLRQEGWTDAAAVGAIISLPRTNSAPDITASARDIILRHELSHGEYFTSDPYAAFVRKFWRTALDDDEREKFRKFLGKDGYDTGLEDLMMNEAQAYLMFTRKSLFFDPALLGINPDRLRDLRAEFYAGMPRDWLRDQMPDPPPLGPAASN
jgi:hypothetical protein